MVTLSVAPRHGAVSRPAFSRNACWLLIAWLLGLVLGAVLQTRLGCPAPPPAAAAATVCERRLSQQLGAARVVPADDGLGGDLGPAHEQQEQPPQQQQVQQQQQEQQQPLQPGRFVPDGYELPEECEKHVPLYAGIFDSLRPWFERGITRADLDACQGAAPEGHDVAKGTPQTHTDHPRMAEQTPRFRLLSWQDDIIVTSGGMERVSNHGQQGLHYFMIQQIQDTARRYGLPNIEFAVGFGDNNFIKPSPNGFPPAMCPLMTFSKHPSYYNLLIPSGEFVKKAYDEWVSRMLADPGPPWDRREERAIGRWSLFRTSHPHVDRFGGSTDETRAAYVKHSNSTGHKDTLFSHTADGSGGLPLSEQRNYKYTFNTDGFTASTRLAKLLATGQTVIKQDSELIEWYYPALQPWTHYAPSGKNGLEEVDRVVRFLRRHDSLARGIAGNAQRFAATHLVTEGRYCYIKVLFEELAKLQRHQPRLEDFPTRIAWDEDVQRFLIEPQSLDIIPED